ncbi:MAG: hypothetical protein IAE98_08650 [Candidatus Kapabacteria bacterium]|nr:hypothetical protein [Candidatus Kapabacteria bacterium]
MKNAKDYTLTQEQKDEIDAIMRAYDGDDEALIEKLKPYAFPDGSWSLYIRWQLDTLSYSGKKKHSRSWIHSWEKILPK